MLIYFFYPTYTVLIHLLIARADSRWAAADEREVLPRKPCSDAINDGDFFRWEMFSADKVTCLSLEMLCNTSPLLSPGAPGLD